jgi:hypothetical protein
MVDPLQGRWSWLDWETTTSLLRVTIGLINFDSVRKYSCGINVFSNKKKLNNKNGFNMTWLILWVKKI